MTASSSEIEQHGNGPTEQMSSGTGIGVRPCCRSSQVLQTTASSMWPAVTPPRLELFSGIKNSFHQLLHACGRACFARTTHHRRGCEVEHDRYLAALYPIWQDASSVCNQLCSTKQDESNTAERRSKTKRTHAAFGHRRANAVRSIEVGNRQSSTIVFLYTHPRLPQICSMTIERRLL
jgi:hypothetical protein